MEKSIHSRRYQMLIVQLQSYRKLNKITQYDVAEKLGITQSQVSKIERCERRLDVLELIDYCRAINLSSANISALIAQISGMDSGDD